MINDFLNLPMAAHKLMGHSYKFINQDWQRLPKSSIPDQGFEEQFRVSCQNVLHGWKISQHREMQLGLGLDSASGVGHEVDIVAEHTDVLGVMELKNKHAAPPDKNDVIVFFAKLLDYLALHPRLMQGEVCPVFMSNYAFEESGLAACLGLGIHPIAPNLRPLPILLRTLGMMQKVEEVVTVSAQNSQELDDLSALVASLGVSLENTWLSARCGYGSDTTLILRANGGLFTHELSRKLYEANALCARLLPVFKAANRNGE